MIGSFFKTKRNGDVYVVIAETDTEVTLSWTAGSYKRTVKKAALAKSYVPNEAVEIVVPKPKLRVAIRKRSTSVKPVRKETEDWWETAEGWDEPLEGESAEMVLDDEPTAQCFGCKQYFPNGQIRLVQIGWDKGFYHVCSECGEGYDSYEEVSVTGEVVEL